MEDRQRQLVVLGATEVRQIWLDSATTVLVVGGRVALRGPLEWLAETIVVPEWHLGPEQTLSLPRAGRLELAAPEGARIVLISPARKSWWHWLKRGTGQVAY